MHSVCQNSQTNVNKIILAALIICVSSCFCESVTRYEFESAVGGAGSSRSPWRSNASSEASLRMFQGDRVEIGLCTSRVLTVRLDRLLYSNDGMSDTINLYLDNIHTLDTLNTTETTDGWGKYWNYVKSHNFTFKIINLRPGNHSLIIEISTSDCYGTELDALDFITDVPVKNDSFFCVSKLIRASNPSSCAVAIDSATNPPSSTSTTMSTTAEVISPSVLTKNMTTSVASTTSTNNVTKSEIFVKQLSFPNDCLTKKNIRLQFKPLTLDGVHIIARAKTIRQVPFQRRQDMDDKPKTCPNRIWQIGIFNNDNQDLGPLRRTNIDYTVNVEEPNQMPFPGVVSPKLTKSVILRYIVPADVDIGRESVYLTLGLVNVTKEVTVGMQYHIRRKKNPSKIGYVTLSQEQNVVGWELSSRAVSPSLENIITLHLDRASQKHIDIDFIRLESVEGKAKVKKENIARNRKWRVRAFIYKPLRNQPQPEGMTVTIDGGKTFDNAERIILYKKPVRKSLTIFEDGRIFPLNKPKGSEDDFEGSKFPDISGFVLGAPKTKISTVDIDIDKGIVNITYSNGGFIRFSITYTKFRTKLIVLSSDMISPNIEFFSTFITDYLAAVNDVIINNTYRCNVTDKAIEETKGRRYTFLKTTPSKLYNVNEEYELFFPKKALPN